jgi:reverse gyrase
MAVEAFMPASDAKITVEKPVREKPSVQELTTIESPGKPIPADLLEEINQPVKKPRAKVKKPKKDPSNERKTDAILIITEKPQAALKIASALGTPRKYAEHNVPFYELERAGKKIIVASAVGHLFNLTYQKGQVGWPIFKMEWVPSFTKTAFTKRYYDLLSKLVKRASQFIVATDYDIEGEVIGWNVLRFIAKKSTAKRMKFTSTIIKCKKYNCTLRTQRQNTTNKCCRLTTSF